jgi:hypothetical protein
MGGSSTDPNKAAMRAQKEQMLRLDDLDIPELEEYLLENPELVGLLEAEQLDDSAMEEISLDPATREAQLSALEGLKEYSEEGITDTDKYAMEQMLGDVAAQGQSQQAGIEADMARKGMDSSGAAVMSKMNAGQQGANQAREKAMQMAAQGSQNRMSALNQLAAQSGNMQQADYSRQANTASAKDAIAKSNAANRQNVNAINLGSRQAIENQRTNTANLQSQVGNSINQQNFNNQMSKATGQGSVANSMSNIAGNAQQGPSVGQAALGGAATGAAIGGPWGAAIGGGIGAVSAMADGGIARPYQLQSSIQDDPELGQIANQLQRQEIQQPRDVVAEAARSTQMAPQESLAGSSDELSGEDMTGALSALSSIMGSGEQETRPQLNLGSFEMTQPTNSMMQVGSQEYANPMANVQQYEDGGIAESPCAEDGGMFSSDGMGEIIDSGMESFADDRVDAKVNDGEMVINIPQQERLMGIIRGEESVDNLGESDIVEGVPREFSEELHERSEGSEQSDRVLGLERLIDMLGKE